MDPVPRSRSLIGQARRAVPQETVPKEHFLIGLIESSTRVNDLDDDWLRGARDNHLPARVRVNK